MGPQIFLTPNAFVAGWTVIADPALGPVANGMAAAFKLFFATATTGNPDIVELGPDCNFVENSHA